MNVYGVDVGGSGIKGAPVDTDTGELLAERVRIKTPKPATPQAILETAVEVERQSGWDAPVGCGFPAVIKDGAVQTAANIDKAAIGFDMQGRFEQELGNPVRVINDGDAAGLAEMCWGGGWRGAHAHAWHGDRHLCVHWGTSPAKHRAWAHRDRGRGGRTPRL